MTDNLDGFAALEGEQARARQALRAFHEAVGGAQRDTAQQLGASQGLVSMWLSGRQPIPRWAIARLLGAVKPTLVDPEVRRRRRGRPRIDRDPDRQEVARADLSDLVRAAGSASAAAALLGASGTAVSNWIRGIHPIPEWVEERVGAARGDSDDVDPEAMARLRKDASEAATREAIERARDHSRNWSARAEELAEQFLGLPTAPPGIDLALRRVIKFVCNHYGAQAEALGWLGLRHQARASRIITGRARVPARVARLAIQWFEQYLERQGHRSR